MARSASDGAKNPATVPSTLALGGSGDVDVWWVDLESADPSLWSLESELSSHERSRATRTRSERLRRLYVGSHAFLRLTLAAYAQCDPASIAYGYNRLGKPKLVEPDRLLEFSLSHSGSLAVVAVARQRRVGVDIERLDRSYPWNQVLSRVVSREEEIQISRLGETQRRDALFRLWTRKEAVAKATGLGLTLGMHSLSVGSAEMESPIGSAVTICAEGINWWLADLPLDPPWVGAVAVEASSDGASKPAIRFRRASGRFER